MVQAHHAPTGDLTHRRKARKQHTMPTIDIRTQDGYRNELIGSSGTVESFTAVDSPATISDDAQAVILRGIGGASTSEFTLPSPANYKGSSQGLLIAITAGASPEDVSLIPAAGTTVDGVATPIVTDTDVTLLLVRQSSTNWASFKIA